MKEKLLFFVWASSILIFLGLVIFIVITQSWDIIARLAITSAVGWTFGEVSYRLRGMYKELFRK